MVEGGAACVKMMLFAFNLIFVIAGIALIAVGAYVNLQMSEYFDFFGHEYLGPGIIVIIVGSLIFFIAFLGCCGARQESVCMVKTFAVLLMVVLVVLVAGAIAGFVIGGKIEDEIDEKLGDALKNYKKDGYEGVTKAWNKLQEEFECCGINSADDWKASSDLNQPPTSCCKVEVNTCNTNKTSDIFGESCKHQFKDWVKHNEMIIGGVALGLAFVLVMGIILACCLAKAIKSQYETV